jgi:hypothetical protein
VSFSFGRLLTNGTAVTPSSGDVTSLYHNTIVLQHYFGIDLLVVL